MAPLLHRAAIISQHRIFAGSTEETKKRKKGKDRNPTVANWVFGETTDVVGSK